MNWRRAGPIYTLLWLHEPWGGTISRELSNRPTRAALLGFVLGVIPDPSNP